MIIAHLADIQIRLFKRKEEYKYIFSKLNDSLHEHKPDIIVVCGDVVHNKVSLSPESVDLTSDFLKMLSEHSEVYMIPGNHDLVVINKSRLDALTPIVKNINSKRIHYYTNSGIINIDESLAFGIFSLIDRENFPINFDKDKLRNYIALYHGSLNGAVYENEQVSKSPDDNVRIFDNYDLALCGDIHKRQQIGKAFYCGSLIQQNYGESLDKGYLLWNLANFSNKFIIIHNKWTYNTIDLSNNQELPNIELNEKPRIRVILSSPTVSEIQKVYADIRKKWNNVEEIVIKHKDEKEEKDNALSRLEDVSTLENIEKLLNEHLKDKVKDEIIRKIIDINKEVYWKVPDISLRNVVWNLEELEISNMFSYGLNNKIDFRNYNGIVGIFAPNRTGKSSIIDSILHIITGKNSKFKKSYNVVNNKESECIGSVVISIGDKRYKIERTVIRGDKKKKSSSTTLRFYEIDGDPENEQQKTDTDKLIRRMFGNYEELTLTSFGLQGKITNFVENTGESYRIKTFSKFLGLDVFESMFNLVKEEAKELESALKVYADLDFSKQIAENDRKLKAANHILKELNFDIEFVNDEKSILEHQIIELKSKVNQEDLTDYDYEIKAVNERIDIEFLNIQTISSDIQNKTNKLEIVSNELAKYNKENILNEISKLEKNVENYHNLLVELADKKALLNRDDKAVNAFDEQIWMQTTEICQNCKFFVEAKTIKSELNDAKEQINELENVLINYANSPEDLRNKREELQKYEKIKMFDFSLKKEFEMANIKLKQAEDDLFLYNVRLAELKEKKEKANDKIEDVKSLKENSKKLAIVNEKLNKKNEELINTKSEIKLREENLKNFEESFKKFKDLEDKYEAYKLYKEAISKDGIPYIILSKSINYINNEINNILENFVNFRVKVETDEEDKDLAIMVQYEDGTDGPIEGASGMEKTITAIAIRAALVKISNLPKCNIFVLDEFASSLDSKYINSVESMLNYLKNMFDIVLLITHSQEIMDCAESNINIVKSQGYSKIISN